MHLSYPAQCLVKQQRVVDALTRIAHFDAPSVAPCLPSPSPLAYRNKIQLPLAWKGKQSSIGMYRKKSHEIIPLTRCLIQSALGEAVFTQIRTLLNLPSIRYLLIRTTLFTQQALVALITDTPVNQELISLGTQLAKAHPAIQGVVHTRSSQEHNTILGEHFTTLAGQAYLTERLLGHDFRSEAPSFFQVNPAQTEKLYAYVLAQAALHQRDRVVDAYGGVGTLALLAADQAEHVWGIECVEAATRNAEENARLNKKKNCTFLTGLAEEKLSACEADVVFLNPPRKGCDPKLIQTLLQKVVKKIVYVSCDPATLARDLALLQPGYLCTAVQPFDMFPQTMHVETVVTLVAR